MTDSVVPDGYMKNAVGHLVPKSQVRELDLLRDDTVRRIVAKWKALHQQLKEIKAEVYADVDDHVRIAGDKYDVELGGGKGGVSLPTYDGEFKIVRSVADSITFTEEIEAAKTLIERCLDRWSASAETPDGAAGVQNLRAIAGRAFAKNRQGNLKKNDVLDLLRLDIDDKDWKLAQDAIRDSIKVTGTSTYIRVYQRVGKTGQYEAIPLDLAAV